MIERLMSALMIFMHVLALKWMLPIAVCFFYPSVGLAEMIEQTAEFRSRHVFIIEFGLLMNF